MSYTQSLEKMTRRIAEILGQEGVGIYLTGSCVLEDFRPGWSDIDMLILTQQEIPLQKAECLVNLRQEMLQAEPEDPWYRSFEGAMLRAQVLQAGTSDRVVYWGTSGQRIADHYAWDSFSRELFLRRGELLFGEEMREIFTAPTHSDFVRDVRRHYETIRSFAVTPGCNLYAYGWMLDIARCLYTLSHDCVIAKTKAGEWALNADLCPDPDVMEEVLRVRRNPDLVKRDPRILQRGAALGPYIQRFADVLGSALSRET